MVDVNPYVVLGVNKNATKEEIDAAFKAAVKRTHPDSGGTEEQFNQVILASLILRDPKKRKKYDEDGVFSQDRPEFVRAMAIEQIATFFINSIDAVIAHKQDMSQFDLISGAGLFFQQKIKESNSRIHDVNVRIKNFERVLKRLKTKNSSDVISIMLQNHLSNFRQEIDHIQKQIEVSNKAREVLKDYSFEPELYSGLILPKGFGI